MNRDDIELYVTGNYDGDIAALENAIAGDPALAAMVADEARFEELLREAAADATFCVACSDVVRGERCESCGAAVRPGGYVVERVLISNAHGRMYVARDADGTQVALKELAFVHAPSADAIAAFEREAKFLRALEHPSIPRFVASFEEGRGVHARYYLAQELVTGEALDRIDDHWYREDEIIALATQVLEILVYLQSLSPMVIHRDIKPANLLSRSDGSIALVDFGAAHVQGTTAGSTTVGTFGYMPIEQLAGQVDATTDVFALGASLLHLLTRQEPWKLAQSAVTINVSAPLRAFLDKMVAPDPRARFASARDALAALERRDELVVRPRRRLRRGPILAVAAAAILMGSGLGVSHFASEPSTTPVSAALLTPFATLKITLPPVIERDLELDGKEIATVHDGYELSVTAGVHQITLVDYHGERCHLELEFPPGETTRFDCGIWAAGEPTTESDDSLPDGKSVDISFSAMSIHAVMQHLAQQCDLNIVMPDTIEAQIDGQLAHVPCGKAIEMLLASHDLSYRYQANANLLRVTRDSDDATNITVPPDPLLSSDATRSEHSFVDDALPAGRRIQLAATRGALRSLLDRIIKLSGAPITLAIADSLGTGPNTLGVTIFADGVAWQTALQAVLVSQGLWYRYNDKAHQLRIAPRKALDAEDEARGHRH